MGQMVRGSNASRGRRFCSSPKHPGQLSGPPSHLLYGYQGSYVGVKWMGREVVPSAKVKNEWSFMSSPPICLRGVDRESFTFYGIFPPLTSCAIMGL
jgi:hypothetical protein